MRLIARGAALLLLSLAAAGAASSAPLLLGDDLFVAGPDVATAPPARRDLFATGFSVTLAQPTAGDAHVTGFSVTVESDTGGDLYAAGSSVALRAPVSDDAAVAGLSVRTAPDARIGGNARIAGGSVTIDGPVGGALAATGGEVVLNAPVGGDAVLAAGDLRFGSEASIAGTLRYTAPEPIEIPESVAPAERIQYSPPAERTDWRATAEQWREEMPGTWEGPGPLAWFGLSLLTLAFLVLVAAVLMAFLPAQVEHLHGRARARPGLSLLAGVAGLSALIGLVPVTAITLVGLPLVPIVILAILVLWILGYLLGVFVVARRVFEVFGGAEHKDRLGLRLAVLAAGLIVAALLNFVPFLGWIANVALLLLGLGALTLALAARLPREAAPPKPVSGIPED